MKTNKTFAVALVTSAMLFNPGFSMENNADLGVTDRTTNARSAHSHRISLIDNASNARLARDMAKKISLELEDCNSALSILQLKHNSLQEEHAVIVQDYRSHVAQKLESDKFIDAIDPKIRGTILAIEENNSKSLLNTLKETITVAVKSYINDLLEEDGVFFLKNSMAEAEKPYAENGDKAALSMSKSELLLCIEESIYGSELGELLENKFKNVSLNKKRPGLASIYEMFENSHHLLATKVADYVRNLNGYTISDKINGGTQSTKEFADNLYNVAYESIHDD
jgi:hypothetical protein